VRAVAQLALARRSGEECPAYMAALDRALLRELPPFGAESYAQTYRDASANGHWLAISLITNAEREGDGATRLWSMSACSPARKEQSLLKRHAVDESRHARLYLDLLDLVFPDAVTPEFREELNQLSPGFTMRQQLFVVEGSPYGREPSVDDFVQMNIAEIRTTIHHLLQRAALAAHCPEHSLPRMFRILDSLLRDELYHVEYTAVLIETYARDLTVQAFEQLWCKRLADFNLITNKELERLTFD
jgi:hypothetical protein